MKPKLVSRVITLVLTLLSSVLIHAQNFGTSASAVWISTCTQDNYFNTTGSIGAASFTGANLGTYTQNSGSLVFRGGEVRSTKSIAPANVCSAKLYYRVYAQSATPGSFTAIDLSLADNCDASTGQFPSGGACSAGDQKWNQILYDGNSVPAPVDLTTNPAGTYTLEVYYELTGSSASTSQCDQTIVLNNGGNNYKASFSIQVPVLSSTNPSTCNGSEGSITISGLTPGATYSISYTDDGNSVGPVSLTANGTGQVTISGLNAGLYSDFLLTINGCTTNLSSGVILSNPVIIPKFNKITLCAGSTPPSLPTTSLNGITGTWSPAVIDNQTSRLYTFTPNANQCAVPMTMTVTVTPRVTPTFSFGTSLSLCGGGSVPTLPTTSSNGITGTWSPSVVSNQNSGTYTFTPSGNQCANTATFQVTVNPVLTPAFSFGNALSICAGSSAPSLPSVSTNGITGTWSPAAIDNQASATYTFTPTAGQCATTTTLTITVVPNATPVFSFGNSLTICAGGSVPALPNSSVNGISGSWSPALVDNQQSATYTFTPTGGVCALPVTFSVTVTPNTTPTFSFGTSMMICAGSSVPTLPGTSIESITGSWSPNVIDNQHSATYTFTPNPGQCATTTSLSVTVTPNSTPVFNLDPAISICAGASVPVLPSTSTNGIPGTWAPAAIDNQHSGSYTFTPAAGLCAIPVVINVTVNPVLTPSFSFGTSLNICAGASVPPLPATSTNGITGHWNTASIDNQASGSYTFTPDAGQCASTASFAVTVSPNITPAFRFGTSLVICSGGSVPALPAASSNGITGSWSPSVVSNNTSGVYTFTPDAGQCATTATFTVSVNPNIVPAFSLGTSKTICAGATTPTLPAISTNGITGTWNPATVDNQHSGVYTFTPDAGQCATSTTFSVTVNPNSTPTFSFGTSVTICQGTSAPALSTTSLNNITGTWSPASIDNQASGTYTFTPAAGQCAVATTLTVTVTPTVVPSFTFGNSLSICAGGSVPALPATSANGISGAWSPSVVDNQVSGSYVFTPAAGPCAVPVTFTVTVTPNTTPTFSFGTSLSLCYGSTAPSLTVTSTNGITGTWSPSSIDNQTSGTYTFTPNAGQCAIPTTLTVTVSPTVTPSFAFGNSLSICAGGTVPALPSVSSNGVSGTWNPSTADNQHSGVYTFTPSGSPCAVPATFTITVTPNLLPSFAFGTSLSICAGATVPVLPNNSDNGVSGSWSPAAIDNQHSATYTFTPNTGQCATPTTLNVTVNPVLTPAFSFGTTLGFCAGSTVPALPSISTNGVSGTWSPASIDNQASATYTFTPAAGQCATIVTLTVTVTPNTVPVFSFGTTMNACAGSAMPVLPSTSDNGVNGSWSPATINNQASGVYTFTPASGQCATQASFSVTINPVVTPSFSFGTSISLCAGASVPVLTTKSTNSITGSWTPAVIDNQASGTYTFTPDAGQCAVPVTLTVTVNPSVVPTFAMGTTLDICQGSTVPLLDSISANGIKGTWNPKTIDNQNSAAYTFIPAAGQCAVPALVYVTVNPNTIPVFNFGTSLTICTGSGVPSLPATSMNGITGTWSPAVVDSLNSGTYTFTPDPVPGQCLGTTTFVVTVNPKLTPTFAFGSSLTICAGAATPALPTISTNGITGSWSPASIDKQSSGVYTFTANAGQCAAPTTKLTVNITPVPVITALSDTAVMDGTAVPARYISGTPAGFSLSWSNSNTSIGLGSSGTGSVPAFTAINKGGSAIAGTITLVPVYQGCTGTSRSYVIKVLPLDKDIFVPNVFTPNGDGKNDILYAYGNNIRSLEFRIFNQWGQQVELITDPAKGWDGRRNGQPQPVGVYVYTLTAEMTDGRTIRLKGNITLLR